MIITVSVAIAVAAAGISVVSADPRQKLAEVQEQVDQLHAEAAEANERHNMAAEDLDTTERRLARAEDDVDRQTDRLHQLTAEIGGFAAASYRSGGLDPAVQAIFAEDPDVFLQQVTVADAFASQQVEQLASVAGERLTLEQLRLTLDDERTRLDIIETVLGDEKAKVEELLAEQQKLLDRLTAEEKARLEAQRQRELAAAEAEREAAASRLSRNQSTDSEPATSSAAPSAEAPVAVSGRAMDAVQAALTKVGGTYVYGGNGPNAFDCSGFTRWAWEHAGVSLSRSSSAQYSQGTSVSSSNLQPGDLLFFGSPISHVAMYIGDGMVVHASNPRTGITTAPAMQAGGSSKPFVGAKRPG